MNNLHEFVIVFDLDDTLYSENDYVISGIKYLEDFSNIFNSFSLKGILQDAYKNGKSDFLEVACKKLKLSNKSKESLLWLYRLHKPKIELAYGVKETLDILQNMQIKVVILTDGRSVTQRLKVNSLGIDDLPLYISEDYESEKPDKKRFLQVEYDYPNMRYIYIADNPEKDFDAPYELKWTCIGANWIKNRIHKVNIKKMPDICLSTPLDIISSLIQLDKDY
ncbi:HAD family hydrolase [Prochlorococcus sp. AH-716-J21]|nr:HAD family hydrolase [Prochlorococcus sp. AH-716-J21]